MLLLSQLLMDEIRSHGARDYPNETCGAMLGVDITLRVARASLIAK